MALWMKLLFAALLLCGVLAEDTPMSEAEYLKSKKKESFRSSVGRKASIPSHLQNMFDNLSEEIVPEMHGILKSKKAAPGGKGYRPAWVDEADSLPQPVKLGVEPVKLKAGDIDVTPAYILGPDDRRYFSSKAFPFSTVAKVYMSNGGRCSGVLIGPRHVLTASHCVNWEGGAYPTTVEINRQGSYVAGSSRVINIYYYKQVATPSAPYTIRDVDDDYVVMILNTRLGDSFGWLGYTTYQSGWDFQNVLNTLAYASDKSNMNYPIYQFGFYGDEADFDGTRSGLAIKTSNDLIPGQSGSPIYTLLSGDRKVVAVTSGMSSPPATNWAGGGQDMVNLINSARKAYP